MKITKDDLKRLVEDDADLVIGCLKSIYIDGDKFGEVTQFTVDTVDALKQALKPKLKPVDMSVLIDSPIDCEFKESSRASNWAIGSLAKIIRDSFVDEENYRYEFCKPRMNYWFSSALFGGISKMLAAIYDLREAGFKVKEYTEDGASIAISITGLRDGYCWPWECDK